MNSLLLFVVLVVVCRSCLLLFLVSMVDLAIRQRSTNQPAKSPAQLMALGVRMASPALSPRIDT